MAQGLSIPVLSPGFDQGLRGFFDPPGLSGKPNNAPNGIGVGNGLAPESLGFGGFGDVLDLGGGGSPLEQFISPGDLQIGPEGTYRFSRFAASASLNFSLSQSTVSVSNDDGTGAFASLTELSISISVSAEFEQALIGTGKNRGGDLGEDFRRASGAVVDRFVAEQIRATLNFDLSFSTTSLSFSSLGEGLSDLSAFEADGSLGGFLTLLEAFFGDEERFQDFIKNLEGFVEGMSGSPSSEGGGEATGPEGAELTTALEGSGVEFRSTSLDVAVDLSFESTSVEVSRSGPKAEAKDPIVLDLDGDGIELTSATQGVLFDLDADGEAEQTATVTGGDGLLALDRNGNGTIDDGGELFGDQHGASNGFEELAKFDSNGDGAIDSKDVVFDQLKVFVDRNLDGVSQADELLTLAQAGIASIDLGYKDISEIGQGGNALAQRSSFTRTDGTTGEAVDALLNRMV